MGECMRVSTGSAALALILSAGLLSSAGTLNANASEEGSDTATESAPPADDSGGESTLSEQVQDASGVDPYITTFEEIEENGYDLDALEEDGLVLGEVADELGVDDLDNPPAGYMGHTVDIAEMTLHVWWVGGQLPASIDSAVRANPAVRVVVHDVPRDQDDVQAIVADSGLQSAEGTESIGWSIDGSSIYVVAEPGSDPAPSSQARGSEASPIPIVTIEGNVGNRAYRVADGAPLKGGALMRRSSSTTNSNSIVPCSTAFPLRRTVNGNTQYWMASAAHCQTEGGNNGASWLRPDGDPLYHGSASSTLPARAYPEKDLLILRSNYSLINRVYRGTIWSTVTGEVGGVDTSLAVGEFVRTGGGNSGEHLNQVTKPAQLAACNGCMAIGSYSQPDEITGSASGDSGGPLFTSSTLAGEVRAAGIISGGIDDSNNCVSTTFYYNNSPCGRVTYSIPIATVVNYLNAIYTGGGWSVAY